MGEQERKRKVINHLIDEITDDLDVRKVENSCTEYLEENHVDYTFDINDSWEKFQSKYKKTLNNKCYTPMEPSRVVGKSKRIRLIAIAAVLAMIPIVTVGASPIKEMLYRVTQGLLIQNPENWNESDISYEGVYTSFEDVPMEIMYPQIETLQIHNIQIDENNNLVATFDMIDPPVKDILFCVYQPDKSVMIEKQGGSIQRDVYNGIEFITTTNNNWVCSVWEYNKC